MVFNTKTVTRTVQIVAMLTHLRRRFKCVTLTQAVQMFTHSVQMFTHLVQMFTQMLHANARRLSRTGQTVCVRVFCQNKSPARVPVSIHATSCLDSNRRPNCQD